MGTLFVLSQKETVKKHKCHENTSKDFTSWVHDLGVSF